MFQIFDLLAASTCYEKGIARYLRNFGPVLPVYTASRNKQQQFLVETIGKR